MTQRASCTYSFLPEQLPEIKIKVLNWLRPFSIFAYFDNNKYRHEPVRFELLASCGASAVCQSPDLSPGEWFFGHVNYDFKNRLYPGLRSAHPPLSGFSDCFFYRPETVCFIPHGENVLHIECYTGDPAAVLDAILGQPGEMPYAETGKPSWQFSMSREEYLKRIASIQSDIAAGDYYELNFCVAAYTTQALSDPFGLFYRLNQQNPSPFSAFYRNGAAWLMCASPERFLYRQGRRIVAQPIKGTSRKDVDAAMDRILKEKLQNDLKERAENVMITDLMRNDLAQCSEVGSVKVSELLGVYSFPTLHHLISTIEAELKAGKTWNDILAVAFPMGSMTGAPKKIVMERIEAYEAARRELFSGTVGYIMPDGSFDFNVVIRSLFYNAKTAYLAYQTGGAITYDSDAEREWEEIKLKAQAMEDIF